MVQKAYTKGERKMKNFLSRLAGVILVFGAILVWMSVSDAINASKTPVDYSTVKESEIEKGMIIEGDLNFNYGAFEESYTTTNGVKTGSSKYTYMIPIGETKYMGLKNTTTDMQEQLENQANKTFSYMLGESTSEPDTIHILGCVKKMDSETKGYLREYMLDMGFTSSEVDQYILDYYIQCENYDNWGAPLMVGIVLLLIGGAIVLGPILIARKQSTYSGGGTVVQNSFENGTYTMDSTSAFQTESDNTVYENQNFEQNNMEAAQDSFGSGLGEGMLDDHPSSGLKLK